MLHLSLNLPLGYEKIYRRKYISRNILRKINSLLGKRNTHAQMKPKINPERI